MSPKVDSILKRARLLSKNYGASEVESLHLLMSFLLEDDSNPQVLLAQAGVTTSMLVLETSKAIIPLSGASQSESEGDEDVAEFHRLLALLSAGGTQTSLVREFIVACEKDGPWREEMLRLVHLFAAARP